MSSFHLPKGIIRPGREHQPLPATPDLKQILDQRIVDEAARLRRELELLAMLCPQIADR